MLRTKELMQLLEQFNTGETGGYARVQIVSKTDKWKPKDIKEIKLVENKIIVELKAAKLLVPEHQAQLINYLNATGIDVGLLVNFGPTKLEYRRFYRKVSS